MNNLRKIIWIDSNDVAELQVVVNFTYIVQVLELLKELYAQLAHCFQSEGLTSAQQVVLQVVVVSLHYHVWVQSIGDLVVKVASFVVFVSLELLEVIWFIAIDNEFSTCVYPEKAALIYTLLLQHWSHMVFFLEHLDILREFYKYSYGRFLNINSQIHHSVLAVYVLAIFILGVVIKTTEN